MRIVSSEWAIRPAGSREWIPIHPDTPRGRRLAAAHGFTPTHKENIAMSAIPVETAPLRAVKNDPTLKPEHLGLLANMKDKAAAAFAWMAALPKTAMGWVKRMLPQSVVDKAAAAWGWTKAKTIAMVRMLGKTGLAGAGMLIVSTADGRRLLSLLAKPFVWAGRLATKAWTKIEDVLYVEEPSNFLDRARNFVSEKMADLRTFLFGSGTQENRYGFLGNMAIKAFLKVGPFLMLDSKTMLATRGVGAALLGAKLFTLAPLLPVAGWIIFAVQAFIVMSTFVGAGEPLLQMAEKATGVRTTATKSEGTQAAKVAAAVTEVPVKQTPTPAPAKTHQQQQRASGKPSARVR